MAKKDPTTADVLEGFAAALAKANGHPDPAGFAAEVKKHLEHPEGEAKPIEEVAAEAIAEVKAEA